MNPTLLNVVTVVTPIALIFLPEAIAQIAQRI
jgi:hypothetical protein